MELAAAFKSVNKHYMLAPMDDWIESNETNMLKNQLASNALVG